MMIIMMMMSTDNRNRRHFKMRKKPRDYWICLCDEYHRNNDGIILIFFRPLFAIMHLTGVITGFDGQESKVPTYWNTSFLKICLSMKIGHQLRFIVIHKQADSLFSLIADGQYRATLLGREKWKELIGSQGSLQYNCENEFQLVVIISFLLVFNITLINLKAQSLSFTILRINCSLQELNN